MAGVLLSCNLQHEVCHTVSVDIGAERAGVGGRIIGQGGLPRLLGEVVHKAEGLIACRRGVGINLRQVDIVAVGPTEVCNLVDRCRGAVAQCREEEGGG